MAIKQRTATGTVVEESTAVVETGKLVGFWRRWTGLIVDEVIILVVMSVLSQAFLNEYVLLNLSHPQYTNFMLLAVGLSILYTFGFLLLNQGQTIGMQLAGIQLKRENGKSLEFITIFVRFLGAMLSALAFRLGYLWCAWDNKKQTWHDKMAGTIVVEKTPVATAWLVAIFIVAGVIATSYNVYAAVIGFQQGLKWGEQAKESIGQTESSTTDTPESSSKVQALLDESDELFVKIRTAGTPKEQIAFNDQNIALLQQAVKLDPTDRQAWEKLSHAYTWSSSKGTVQDGVDAAAKALELSPNDAGYMSTLGRFQILSGKIPEGVLQLEKSVRADNTDPEAHYWLANGYYNLKIMDKAREHLNEAISLYEKNNQQGDYDERILIIRSELAKMQ